MTVTDTIPYNKDACILVVRPGALGDTILTVPLLESIRRTFPGAQITWLGTERYQSLIPPGIQFEAFDDPRWLWLFGSDGEGIPSRAPCFHMAYVILNNPHRVIDNLQRAGTAQVRQVTSTPPQHVHVVQHLHRGLGLAMPPKRPALPFLSTCRNEDLIWVHPGSGGPRKCIPLHTIISVVNSIREDTGWDVAVTAGEEDAFLKNDPVWQDLINARRTLLLDSLPLATLCQELAGARLFIGNDCGISHLAAGMGVPSIVFFSTTNPTQWTPWTEENRLMICTLTEATAKPDIKPIRDWITQLSRLSTGWAPSQEKD